MLRSLAWIVAACLIVFAHAANSAEIEGIVTDVHDGDTVTLVNWQYTYHIRLADIDAPELSQRFGRESRASLFHLCALKRAVAETRGDDPYGRPIATVTCAGVDANAAQVQRGWAWVYRHYAPKHSPLYEVERKARLDRRGLWADDLPIQPWEWRATQREGKAK